MLYRGSIMLHLKSQYSYLNLLIKQPKFIITKGYKILNSSCISFIKSSYFHTSTNIFKEKEMEPTEKELQPRMQHFQQIKLKDKNNFLKIIHTYNESDKVKRGHLEFIYAAMKYMEDFGVQEDLETYKKLMDVFPKGKMIPRNLIQAEFLHFGRHQQCAITMLDKMEFIGIQPDKEMKEIVINIFGKSSVVYKKLARMLYWMPKFKNANPYLLPNPLPDDVRELARLALKKMSVDTRTKIAEYEAEELEDSIDKTWIMSAQSPVQQKYIKDLPEDKAIYVEGPFLVWLRRISMTYYILRAESKIYPEFDVDDDDVSNLSLFMFGERKPKELVLRPQSVHEQEDGIILGICCTVESNVRKSRDRRSLMDLKDMVKSVTGRDGADFINYGNWCGLGGSGKPVDSIDECCQNHDFCYDLATDGVCEEHGEKGVYQLEYKWKVADDGTAVCNDEKDRCTMTICFCDAILSNCLKSNIDSYDNQHFHDMDFFQMVREAEWISS